METSARKRFITASITCFALYLVGTVFSQAVHAQTLKMPGGWIETSDPGALKDYSKLMKASRSRHEWRVALFSDQLQVADIGGHSRDRGDVVFPPHFRRTDEMLGRAISAKAGDQWLVGFSAGEFGGGLWWTNQDGRRVERLSRENVQAFVTRDEEVLVFTGLSHMGYDKGTAYSFHPAPGGGELVRIADLDSAPAAAWLQDDGSVLIAVSNGVVSLRPDGSVERLYKQDEMRILYPNSVVGQGDHSIFVGMRFYVLRLQRRKDGRYESTWFERASRRHN